MKTGGKAENEDADGLDARADAALWDLLGHAARPEAGPYFARRVLREVSLHEAAHPAGPGRHWWQPAALWRACRRLPRVAFVAGAPVAALLLLFMGLRLNPAGSSAPIIAPVFTTGGDPVTADDATAAQDGAAPAPTATVAANALPEGVSAQDVEVIADLDTLLKHEENRLWTEDTARF